MIILWHRGGPKPCLGPALTVKVLPSKYEITADNVVKLDGIKPRPGEAMICGTCKEPIHPQWLYRRADPELYV